MVKLKVDRIPPRWRGLDEVALDDEDALYIQSLQAIGAAFAINGDGYPVINSIPLHRLFFPRLPRGWCVDHSDDDKLNCQRANFQILTMGENGRKAAGYSPLPSHDEEKVYFNKTSKKWQCSVPFPKEFGWKAGRVIRSFPTREEAVAWWHRYVDGYLRARALVIQKMDAAGQLTAYRGELNAIIKPRAAQVLKLRHVPSASAASLAKLKRDEALVRQALKRKLVIDKTLKMLRALEKVDPAAAQRLRADLDVLHQEYSKGGSNG